MVQELVFTTLPNQRKIIDGKQYLSVSVFVTPRIKSVAQTTLGQVPDMLNWAKKIKESKFLFRIKGLPADIEANLDTEQIDFRFYESVFHRNIKVEKAEMETLHLKQINSFPVKHITDFLQENFKLAAIESPKKLLPATFFIDPDKLGLISEFKIDPKAPEEAENAARKQPLQQKNIVQKKTNILSDINTSLRSQKFIPFNKMREPEKDFTQLRAFHTLEKAKIKPIVLTKPSFEFHNIISVINSFPQMMRKLGFILDFTLPYTDAIPAKGTIHLVPQSLSFTEVNTTVSTPISAYAISGDSFLMADAADSLFAAGFVKINSDAFSIVQVDSDGLALKTVNAVDNKTIEVARFFENKSNLTLNPQLRPMNLRAKPMQSPVQPSGMRVVNQTGLQKERIQLQRIRPIEKLKLLEPPASAGLPTMRSAGIALIRNGISKHVALRLERNFRFQELLVDKPVKLQGANAKIPLEILYSDDVVMAYRMDIAYEDDPQKWFSLHQRENKYSWYDEAGVEHPIQNTSPDEGYVELALAEQRDKKENLFVPETLARWEGWSLSVGRPGLSIDESNDHPAPELKDKHDFLRTRAMEAKKYAYDQTLDFKLNAQSGIVPGTLPKLRFGKKYRLRIRTVDLAGNSLPLSAQASSTEIMRTNIKYYRYEPLACPISLVGNTLRDGEFLEQMVIRSNYDKTAKAYERENEVRGQASDGKSLRYMLPPRNSQLMAESHGKFDTAFGNNPDQAKKIYSIIASHEGLFQPAEGNKEKIYALSDVSIIYLPDPMAAGIALFIDEDTENTHTQDFEPRMFSFFSKEEIMPSTTNTIQIPDDWYNAGFMRISLEEGSLASKWDKENRVFTISLPKGLRIKLKVSTFWREKDVKEFSALWHLIKEGAASKLAELESVVLKGQHWMLSPPRNLELIHAVQQPVEAPVLIKILPEREIEDTSADLNLRFSVHGESTDFAEVQAVWTEQVDDGISVEIETKNFRSTIPDIDIYYNDDVVTIGNIPELRPDLNVGQKREIMPVWKNDPSRIEKLEVQPGAAKLNTLYRKQAFKLAGLQKEKETQAKTVTNQLKFDIAEYDFHLVKLLDIRNFPIEHSFGDTHHRWVDYSVVATSRYTDYFASIVKQGNENSFKRESEPKKKVNILSTARPVKPEVDYIIPTFEWIKSEQGGTYQHTRKGGGLRIYLKRPWFSSGDDEMLAVILPNQDLSGGMQLMMNTQAFNYTDMFTHWASDPLFVSVPPMGASPLHSSFRLDPEKEKDLVYPEKSEVKAVAVAYPVQFDAERQLWFADIAIDCGKMYYPFIKLALARYQKHSLRPLSGDLCLSSVVLSGMVQLVPERSATIKVSNESDSVRLSITVSGPVYNERMAKFDVHSSLRFSIIDSKLPQPVQGVITDGKNKRKLETDSWEADIRQTLVYDNVFTMTHEFRIPKEYKTNPYQIVIEEIEHGPARDMVLAGDGYKDRLGHPQETDRLVYADVFKINE